MNENAIKMMMMMEIVHINDVAVTSKLFLTNLMLVMFVSSHSETNSEVLNSSYYFFFNVIVIMTLFFYVSLDFQINT